MAMDFFAHRLEDGTRQSVREHLAGTAEYARAFGRSLGMEEVAAYAALLHDVGKYTPGFQRRLLDGGPKVDHATAGMLEALRHGQVQASFAIAGHHTGLPDMGFRGDTAEQPTLHGRRKRRPGKEIEDYAAHYKDHLPVPPPLPITDDLGDFLRTHMLFSALVDADWLDTERFMQAGKVERGAGESIAALAARFDAWLAEKGWQRPPPGAAMTLNGLRSEILHTCLARAALPPGLFALTVPTGGGKTTASLGFALAHARAHGLERIIYVIPYTSIIDQVAKVFRQILGAHNVLEHHAQFPFDPEDDRQLTPAQKKLQLAAENWDAPVIVTTAVQFFESLFASGKARSRKLHNIARSVVVFDEAQMLPPPYLLPCVAMIARLARDFGVSAVLCTATQPSLNKYLAQYAPQLHVRELAPEPARLNAAFRRTNIRLVGPLADEALVEALNAQAQVLCVVNARRHAQTLYAALAPEGSFMLSTLLYPAHRERKLDEIRARLRAELPCRVVSTSLIEAGVDIDFPAVYRALAGLDAILQAAGRCNREGALFGERGVVTVFEPQWPPPRTFLPSIEAARRVLREFEDPASLAAIRAYFDTLYDNRGAGLDQKEILRLICQFAFRTISDNFQLIEQHTRAVYVLFRDEKARLLEHRLRAGERSRELLRALGRYGVNVYADHFRALREAGTLERLDEELYLLTAPGAYDEGMGLALAPAGGEGNFA